MKLLTFLKLSPLRLVLLFLACSKAYSLIRNKSARIIPGRGNEIIHQKIISSDREPLLKIGSNIPVTILRYWDEQFVTYRHGTLPIKESEFFVNVKTNCPKHLNRVHVDINYDTIDGRRRLVGIEIDSPRIPKENNFLNASKVKVEWKKIDSSIKCENAEIERQRGSCDICAENGENTCWSRERNVEDQCCSKECAGLSIRDPMGESWYQCHCWGGEDSESGDEKDSSSRSRRVRGLGHLEEQDAESAGDGHHHGRELNLFRRRNQTCKISAEIVLNVCAAAPEVKAPKFRVIESFERDPKSIKSNECETDHKATIIFPEKPVVEGLSQARYSTVNMPRRCEPPKSVDGRPFLDSEGEVLTANTLIGEKSCWASSANSTALSLATQQVADETSRCILASQWTNRGIGEHSSVASFAAFTLRLMANGAPPDLIRDSLMAALDEVNHALTSFEVASILAGNSVEPAHFPPSSQDFKNDMTALAVSTALEGCVDETLAALAAVAEADAISNSSATILARNFLREKLHSIALDEGRHSSLAWRTVRWICSVDAVACETVKHSVFHPMAMRDAVKHRFPHGEMHKEWETIRTVLVPFVTKDTDDEEKKLSPDICNLSVMESDLKSVSEVLVHNIIHGVVCNP